MKSLFIILSLLVALTLNAKDKPMALKDGLVAMWNMGQDPALYEVWDQSHNGNHLTGVNFDPSEPASTRLVDGIVANGKRPLIGHKPIPGKAIQLNGTAILKLASNAGISHQQNSFTVGFWFKPLILDT